MNPLTVATCGAIVGCLLLAVGYPLILSRSTRARLPPDRRWSLAEQRDLAYASIRELDFDHAVSKVNDEDYRQQRATLEESAVAILRQLDQLDGSDPADAEQRVTADVAALWGGGPERVDPAEALGDSCPSCGGSRASDHRFCPHCGARLHVAG